MNGEASGVFSDCVMPDECQCEAAEYHRCGVHSCAIPRFHEAGVTVGIMGRGDYIVRFDRDPQTGGVAIDIISIDLKANYRCTACWTRWSQDRLDLAPSDCPRCGKFGIAASDGVQRMTRWHLTEPKAADILI